MQRLPFKSRTREWLLGDQCLVMGILNVTPDSFSDGGAHADTAAAVECGLQMAAAGADILDIGGESTRPGAELVTAEQEQARVVPVIRELARRTECAISVDTRKAAVAAAAVAAGAEIINDVSGMHYDPGMAAVMAATGAGCVIMHMRGTPETMQNFTDYQDLVADIRHYFSERLQFAADAGIPFAKIMLDPGIGFSKTAEQNLQLIAHLGEFRALGRPVLAGPSRKSFIGKLLGINDPQERLAGTAGAVAACVMCGADVLRVHDVAPMRDTVRVAAAVRAAAAGV
jgi:dihydropteroate synthase